MHNQISEGSTEFIARKIMEVVGDEVRHPDRYAEQVKLIGRVFDALGLSNAISTYLTEPRKIVKILEEKDIEGKDALHYMSETVNSSGRNVPSIQVFIDNINTLCTELEADNPLESVANQYLWSK